MVKVVFRAEVRGIAKAGEVKNVSSGYARNYLFPRQLAFPATESALRQWETERQGVAAKSARRNEAAQNLAQRVGSAVCTIAAKAGPGGRLFGAVTRKEIIEALAKQGVALDKRAVRLVKPIKEIGTASVAVQVSAELQARLQVNVVPE